MSINSRRLYSFATHRLSASWVVAALLFVCCGAMTAMAEEGGAIKNQYSIGASQTEDGLPSNSVQAVVQTRDEFIGVLADAGAEQAADIALALRDGVEVLRLPHPARPDVAKQCVTITLGVATIVPSPATTPKELITAADHALYQAKQRGRNTYHATTIDSPVVIRLGKK